MRDMALEAAGALAIVVALAHGAIGEWRVFSTARIEPRGARTLMRLMWQASTIDWICFGVLLIVAPALDSPRARVFIVAVACAALGYGAFANAVATRCRHPGWALMGLAVALALFGLLPR